MYSDKRDYVAWLYREIGPPPKAKDLVLWAVFFPVWLWRHIPYLLKSRVGAVMAGGALLAAMWAREVVDSGSQATWQWITGIIFALALWVAISNRKGSALGEIGIAARKGNLLYLEWLLRQGVSARSDLGKDALSEALCQRSAGVINVLLQHGAELDASFDISRKSLSSYFFNAEFFLKNHPSEIEDALANRKKVGSSRSFRDISPLAFRVVWTHILTSQNKETIALLMRRIDGKAYPLFSAYLKVLQDNLPASASLRLGEVANGTG